MASFTPGPWAVHPEMAWVCDAADLEGRLICGMCRTADGIHEDETKANANLIAAAPRLFAACEALLERYRVMGCGDGPEATEAAYALAQARGNSI